MSEDEMNAEAKRTWKSGLENRKFSKILRLQGLDTRCFSVESMENEEPRTFNKPSEAYLKLVACVSDYEKWHRKYKMIQERDITHDPEWEYKVFNRMCGGKGVVKLYRKHDFSQDVLNHPGLLEHECDHEDPRYQTVYIDTNVEPTEEDRRRMNMIVKTTRRITE